MARMAMLRWEDLKDLAYSAYFLQIISNLRVHIDKDISWRQDIGQLWCKRSRTQASCCSRRAGTKMVRALKWWTVSARK